MEQFKNDLVTSYNFDAKLRKHNEVLQDSWKFQVREKFVNTLKAEKKTTILELGAGVGTDSKYFMQNGFQVLAVDLSDEMVKESLSNGVNAQVLDLYDIDKLGQKFDAVYSMNVMLHIPAKDINGILLKIQDVLNDDGLFYYGSYGGITEEIVINDDRTNNLPRFFSKFTDEDLLKRVNMFKLVYFDVIDIDTTQQGYHYQSLLLRK